MAILCVFNTREYGTGKLGFLAAKASGNGLFEAGVDSGDCSYSVMYSVKGLADSVSSCLGGSVEIGIYRENLDGSFEYASLDEVDSVAMDMNVLYDSLESGFEAVLKNRQQLPALVSRAMTMLIAIGESNIHNMNVLTLAKIGRALGSEFKASSLRDGTKSLTLYPLSYDDNLALWVGTQEQASYRPCANGHPDFSEQVKRS